MVSQHSREVARGSLWSLAGSAFFKLTSFAYVVMLAHAASQDDIGVFYLALSALSLVWVLSDLGISGAFLRYVPFYEGRNEHGKIKELFTISYRYTTAFSFVLVAMLFYHAGGIGEFYSSPLLPDAIRMLSAYVLLGNLFRINYIYTQGRADIKASQAYQNLQNLLKLVLTAALFWLYGPSVATIAAGFVLSFALALLASSIPVFRSVSSIAGGGSISRTELVSEIVPLGILIAVVQSFYTIVSSSDRLMLGFMAGPAAASGLVAVYTMATTLALVLMVFPASVGNIFLPVVSRLAGKNDMDAMRAAMATAQRWSLFITLPVAAVMVVFSGDMLAVFYGSSYAPGALAMSLFTLGMVASAFSYPIALTLTALRLVRIELHVAAAVAGANVLLNLLLIPAFSMEGAAFASAAGFVLGAALFTHFAGKHIGFRHPPEAFRLLAAACGVLLIMGLAAPLLSGAASGITGAAGAGEYMPKALYLALLGALICASAALFAAFAILLKCLHAEDAELLRRALARGGVPAGLAIMAENLALRGVARNE